MEDVAVLTPSAGENLEASAILTTGASAEPVQGAAHDERLEGNTLAGAQPQAAPPTPSSSQPLYVHRRESYRRIPRATRERLRPTWRSSSPPWPTTDKSRRMEVQRLGRCLRPAGSGALDGRAGSSSGTVDVPEAGLYNIEVVYYPAPGRGTAIEREIHINGEILFSGAELLGLSPHLRRRGPVSKGPWRATKSARARWKSPMWQHGLPARIP